jgi:hypothetical protein
MTSDLTPSATWTPDVDDIFLKAAQSSIALWTSDADPEELAQDLWVWYLERPGTRAKMEPLSKSEKVKTARLACNQILSERVLDGNRFNHRNLYSSDSVREALHGLSSNKYLREILPIAMEAIQRRDDQLGDLGNPRGYAEAIRIRYEDKAVPIRGSADEAVLKRAVKSLTDEINLLHLTAPVEGAGSRGEVFPGSRRASGGHSDPTGDIAVMLIENPEIRDDYLAVTGIEELIRGRGANAQHI